MRKDFGTAGPSPKQRLDTWRSSVVLLHVAGADMWAHRQQQHRRLSIHSFWSCHLPSSSSGSYPCLCGRTNPLPVDPSCGTAACQRWRWPFWRRHCRQAPRLHSRAAHASCAAPPEVSHLMSKQRAQVVPVCGHVTSAWPSHAWGCWCLSCSYHCSPVNIVHPESGAAIAGCMCRHYHWSGRSRCPCSCDRSVPA